MGIGWSSGEWWGVDGGGVKRSCDNCGWVGVMIIIYL